MAARICPQCNARITGTQVAAHSDGMECPTCHTILEVANGSRYIATTLGLIAAVCVYRFERGITAQGSGLFGWLLPIVYAYFTLSVISPLALMSVADLQKAPPAPQPIASADGGGHDAGHH
jgi:ribosomal protein S27AE